MVATLSVCVSLFHPSSRSAARAEQDSLCSLCPGQSRARDEQGWLPSCPSHPPHPHCLFSHKLSWGRQDRQLDKQWQVGIKGQGHPLLELKRRPENALLAEAGDSWGRTLNPVIWVSWTDVEKAQDCEPSHLTSRLPLSCTWEHLGQSPSPSPHTHTTEW